MPTRLERVVDEHKKFLHRKAFAECQSKAMMTGSLSFLGGSAIVFVAQELLKRHLPYSRDKFLLLPVFVGTISAYIITQRQTRMCMDMWLAMEEKHSVLTPMEGDQFELFYRPIEEVSKVNPVKSKVSGILVINLSYFTDQLKRCLKSTLLSQKCQVF